MAMARVDDPLQTVDDENARLPYSGPQDDEVGEGVREASHPDAGAPEEEPGAPYPVCKGRALDYDEVLSSIGGLGFFQVFIFGLLSLVAISSGIAVMVWNFTGMVPNYRCRVPQCERNTSSYYLQNETHLPSWYDGSIDKADRCKIPQVAKGCPANSTSFTTNSSLFSGNSSNSEMDNGSDGFCAIDDLVFDTSIRNSTVTQDYELLCGSYYRGFFYSASYMLGMLFGSFFFGWYSDNHGRRKALLAAVGLVSIAGSSGASTGRNGGYWYVLLRFFTGMGGIGCFMLSSILAVEHASSKLIGVLLEIPFAVGEIILGVEAYIVRDWVSLQELAHIPMLVLVPAVYFLLPESPRWLIDSGRREEAEEVIRQVARYNGKPVPEQLLKNAITEHKNECTKAGWCDLFSSRPISRRTMNMCLQWFSVTLCYYGLSFASTSLDVGLTPYESYWLSVSFEIPGYLFSFVAIERYGRQPILFFCQVMCGVACLACAIVQGMKEAGFKNLQGADVATIALSLLGKMSAAATYSIVYLYTSELFPTPIRSQALGICSVVARLGGIFAVLLENMKAHWLPAPIFTMVMGCVSLFAGFFTIYFPETLGSRLPNTMEEALRVGKDDMRSSFREKPDIPMDNLVQKETQDTQDKQCTRDKQDTQETHFTQDNKDTQDNHNIQDVQDAQDT